MTFIDALLEVTKALWFIVLAVVGVTALAWLSASSGEPTDPRPTPESDVFGPVRQTDPGFTPDAFSARVLAAYAVVQRARMVKQPAIAKKWVTPMQLVGLENEASYAKRADVDRTIAPIKVARIRAMRVRSDGSDFFVDVKIVAETTCLGRRALMNDPIVGLLEQDDAPIAIDEMWTFCRPIGSLTPTHPVDPGHCANCGAPVEHPSVATCPYCGKAQRNAEWLVSAIASNEFCSAEFAQPSSTSQTGAS